MKILALFASLLLVGASSAQTTPADAKSEGGPKLVSNGREPRKLLRYEPPVGTVDKIEFLVREKNSLTGNGIANPEVAKDSTFKLTVRAEVMKQTEEGSEIAMEIVSAAAISASEKPAALKVRNDGLAKLKGAKCTTTIAPAGISTNFTFTPVNAVSAEASEALNSLSEMLVLLMVPLAEEPVGPGASWVLQETPANKASKEVDLLKYTLQSSTKDRFTIVMSASEPIDMSGFGFDPRGMAVTYQTHQATLTGEYTLDDAHALPIKASISRKGVIEGTARHTSGQSIKLSGSFEKSLTLKPLQSTPPKGAKYPGASPDSPG